MVEGGKAAGKEAAKAAEGVIAKVAKDTLREADDVATKVGKEAVENAEKKAVEHAAPDFTKATIDDRKIAGYALNPDHPVGRNKYRVINSRTGLTAGDSAAVRQQILAGARNGTPILGKADQYGQRWAVDLPLTGPNGTMTVRSAWILRPGSTTPELTTISIPRRSR